MSLALLQIHHLRNIKTAGVELHPHINIITGANGSGKTSFLEAIYLLGTGHSFRTREITPMVMQGEAALTVFARCNDEQTISLQKSLSLPTQVRLNSKPCQSSSALAHFLPCQLFYQDMFQIIDAGPSVRRAVLDWGMFHVKHSYHLLWKNYKHALKQRNCLLKQKAVPSQFTPWNNILDKYAMELHQLREAYFQELNREFQGLLAELTDIKCSLQYYKGWDKRNTGITLNELLISQYSSDLLRQYTQFGAHQADLEIHSEDFKARQFLSRGQQKIILFALKFAQVKLMSQVCIFLCDDLASELDEDHLKQLFSLISKFQGQFFITSVESRSWEKLGLLTKDKQMFTMQEGQITAL